MLADVPIILILIGLAAYTVLAGADFGAGFWTLFPEPARAGPTATREHARHAMGPVWEANHVWLIFVLVVCWTAYPTAFASITSTLAVPLFLAAVGIIMRGAAYALRGQLNGVRGERAIERLFAVSSVLTPFALGTVVGGIASGRVPAGNARGDLLTSWLNPTSIVIGALAIATSSYLAAVYLAADARRLGHRTVELDFRTRAVWSGLAAGILAVAGLIVVRFDARPIWDGLTTGAGLAMAIVSAAAGITTLSLVAGSRFGAARASAALAVGAMIWGWGVAQNPYFLRDLTVMQTAAGRSTLIAVIVAVGVGAVVLLPSLALLFTLFLRGRLDFGVTGEGLAPAASAGAGVRPRRLRGPITLAVLLAGVCLTVLSNGGWMQALGIAFIGAGSASAFTIVAVMPGADHEPGLSAATRRRKP